MVKIDVSNFVSIDNAFKSISKYLSEHGKSAQLQGLVNNAGVFQDVSADTLMNVNVTAVYNVSETFRSILADDAHIVNLSSMLGPSFLSKCNKKYKNLLTDPDITWDTIQEIITGIKEEPENTLNKMGVRGSVSQNSLYGLSKALCNSITLLHAKKFRPVKVNSCHPGFIFTDMTKHYVNGNAANAKSYGMQTTDEGTVAPFFLLTKAKTSGKYYDNGGNIASML